jgi:hypothetical protein
MPLCKRIAALPKTRVAPRRPGFPHPHSAVAAGGEAFLDDSARRGDSKLHFVPLLGPPLSLDLRLELQALRQRPHVRT